MTPKERIEAVEVSDMTDAQRLSMLCFLLGALADAAEHGMKPDTLAYAVEIAGKVGRLAK